MCFFSSFNVDRQSFGVSMCASRYTESASRIVSGLQFFFFFLSDFIYLKERERKTEQAGVGAEGER